ncbi:MAG: energy-coupled thiamine transporter ThiT [Oscillospiraceae bacterium]|nr:energy-coupled thiamine transporter ThiT [Oscillospiraceae bacterium]MCR4760730.1 energy-coupled thiamine transporter ThiT [Oscillospiraceae bacterium]
MKKNTTKMLVEGAMMLALAIVLSLLTPFQKILPFGGSITLVSMLPICIFSIKYGVGKGLGVSFLFAVFQFAQGTIKDGLFGWGLTPGMLITCILLDYFLAYTVLGFAGFARKKGLAGWITGVVVALTMRFLCHFFSGVYVFGSTGKIWEQLDFVAENKYIYSLMYNGAYMLPEIILTVLVTVILFKIPQVRNILTSEMQNETAAEK